jgi:hypothetical protein
VHELGADRAGGGFAVPTTNRPDCCSAFFQLLKAMN